ncbi:hypothetical protein CPLU01_10356 [Colletotrichum plurivorum]|uniref:Uncharacterized protein n=1 Tax=Colletotrichum plurivorum TaxID=2175906 RepID=A0A8H6K5B1_9PEZI|nr:hypothetical protein CPLU01_10356 [Colletotrichum plurivorum]
MNPSPGLGGGGGGGGGGTGPGSPPADLIDERILGQERAPFGRNPHVEKMADKQGQGRQVRRPREREREKTGCQNPRPRPGMDIHAKSPRSFIPGARMPKYSGMMLVADTTA